MNIDYNYSGIQVKAVFSDNINMLYDMSGTGKSFLFLIIQHYAKENGLACRLFDYKTDNSEQHILTECINADILIFDNADLYISKDLLGKLKTRCKCILISLKDLSKIEFGSVGLYSVLYSGNKMEVNRVE